MHRWIGIGILGTALWGEVQVPPKPKPLVEEEIPPEEDASAKKMEYTFNPLQAKNEMDAGEVYFKKGNYPAAANRFREATLWNPTLAEAFLRLGEAAEKQRDRRTEKEAYGKYLEIVPESKKAPEIKKKIAKL